MNQFDYQNATDAELLEFFETRRDARGFEELMSRHAKMVAHTAASLLDKKEDIEDVVQATFLALAMAGGKLRDKSAVPGWLQRTARNCAMRVRRTMSRRKEKGVPMLDYVDASSGSQPDEIVISRETRKLIHEEIARLPPRLSVAFVLCCVEGMTQKEAARQLDISQSTVNERLTAARNRLRRKLLGYGVTLSVSSIGSCMALHGEKSFAMAPAFISALSSKVTLYASGETTSVGLSEKVVELANGVLASMKLTRLTVISCVIFALALGGVGGFLGFRANTVTAGTLFIDETFNDGNHTDGDPVVWTSTNFPGVLDSSSGDLKVAPQKDTDPTVGIFVEALNESYRNVSIRTEGKVADSGGFIGIGARTHADGQNGVHTGYFASVVFSTEFGGSVVVAGRTDAPGVNIQFPTSTGNLFAILPYDVRQHDTAIQLDVFGQNIQVSAWRAGDTMPASPLFDVNDDTYDDPGVIALGVSAPLTDNLSSEAIFRNVKVGDMPIQNIPEPTTAALGSFVLSMLALAIRQRRYV